MEDAQNQAKSFTWTTLNKSVAEKLAEGIKTQREIAEELGVHETSISRWKKEPEFLLYVDKLTLENELASRAGLLRALYKGAKIKESKIPEDKTTHLDYLKEIAELQALKKQQIQLEASIGVYDVAEITEPDVQEAAEELAKRISKARQKSNNH